MFEQGINDQDINIIPFHRTKSFFGVGGNSMFPFDVFAASFYLAARYEEYLPHKKDHFNRFDAEQSLAFNEDFLHQPVINIWVNELVVFLKGLYPDFTIPERKYKFITTIDVDNAYAYKEKGFVRTIMGYAKSLITLNFKDAKDRTKTLLGIQKDPYDTFDYQEKLIKDKNLTFNNIFVIIILKLKKCTKIALNKIN